MARTSIYLAALAVTSFAVFAGCGDDAETSTSTSSTTSSDASTSTSGSGGAGGDATSSTTGTGGGGGNENPPPPAIGTQIDRMGRPAINTALNHTFDSNPEAKDLAKDTWNADPNQAGWVTAYGSEVEANLAILDALDTVCGNQVFAGPTVDATRYSTLGGVLADDRLWVKTDGAACNIYLGVEANATNLVPNGDCGGRTMKYEVIDASYSLLAAGDLGMSVKDNVAADNDTGGEIFPYLADPH